MLAFATILNGSDAYLIADPFVYVRTSHAGTSLWRDKEDCSYVKQIPAWIALYMFIVQVCSADVPLFWLLQSPLFFAMSEFNSSPEGAFDWYHALTSILALTCRRLHEILQPELESRITPELAGRLLRWATANSKPNIVALRVRDWGFAHDGAFSAAGCGCRVLGQSRHSTGCRGKGATPRGDEILD
jgi:hypothetical protein